MHRGPGPILVLAALALALALWLAPGARARKPARPSALASVSGRTTGAPIAPGFVGVSVEYPALYDYTGHDPRAVNPVFETLLHDLAPGQAPVLRVGGDSTDRTWYPLGGAVRPPGVNYDLSKGWLSSVRTLAGALHAHLILGVNLAAGRPDLAAAEGQAFERGIGRRYISALEIGNEADLYGVLPYYRVRGGRAVLARSGRYDLQQFSANFTRWARVLPRLPLAGPAFAETSWLKGLGGFIDAQRRLRVVTVHRYPLRGCESDPASPSYATIPNLLKDSSSEGLSQSIAPALAVARARGLPLRVGEMNSVACSGTSAVSNTFASALWALDTLFSMARVGVQGVNLHTLPGARYELFSFRHAHGRYSAVVHPEYYGLLMFALAAPPGSRLSSVSAPGGPVKVWATRGPDAHIRVVLINKDYRSSHALSLRIPAASGRALAQWLRAPAVDATAGVSLDGLSFGDRTYTAKLTGRPALALLSPSHGTYSVRLPAASAVLLTLAVR